MSSGKLFLHVVGVQTSEMLWVHEFNATYPLWITLYQTSSNDYSQSGRSFKITIKEDHNKVFAKSLLYAI